MRRIATVALACALLLALWPAKPAAAEAALPPPDMFQLPFPIGDTWTFNGVHGARKEAIDFSIGRPWPRWKSDTSQRWVVAAAAGTIRKTSACGLEIDHADGWTSVYYHIENILRDSGTVQANERIANIANTPREAACEGGYATGPHLHFALKHNGQDVPINGLALSGWRIHSGRGRYDSSCARMYLYRGDQKLCPYTDPLLNDGIPAAPDQSPGRPDEFANAGGSAGHTGDESAQIEIDSLAEGATVGGVVQVQGWAIDHAGLAGSGIDHIHLYLDGPAGQGGFIGEAAYTIERGDVAAALGDERYRASGFQYAWDTRGLAPGQHTLYIYAHSTVADWSFATRSIVVAA